jgi:hypothetical protein
MSETTFKKRLEEPNKLTLAEVSEVLQWRDEHPAETSRVKAALEARRREEYDKAALRDAWAAQGGDAQDFEKQWPKLREEHLSSRLREIDSSTKSAAFSRVRSNF